MARSGFGIALSRPPLSRQPRPQVLRREPGRSRGGGQGLARPHGERRGANPVLLTLGPRTATRNTVAMGGVLVLNFAVELNGGANPVLHPDCLWAHLVRGAGLAISQPRARTTRRSRATPSTSPGSRSSRTLHVSGHARVGLARGPEKEFHA